MNSPERQPKPTARSRRTTDPSGKAALFSSGVKAAPDIISPGRPKEGKQALYSTGPRQAGTVVVQCSKCTARARISLVDLGVRFLSLSVWIPGRREGHWLRCPSCREHTWCSIGWMD